MMTDAAMGHNFEAFGMLGSFFPCSFCLLPSFETSESAKLRAGKRIAWVQRFGAWRWEICAKHFFHCPSLSRAMLISAQRELGTVIVSCIHAEQRTSPDLRVM